MDTIIIIIIIITIIVIITIITIITIIIINGNDGDFILSMWEYTY